MEAINSLPDECIDVETVNALTASDRVLSAHPLVSINRADTTPATFEGQDIAALYLQVEATKSIVAYSERDGEWQVVETAQDVVRHSPADTFEIGREELCDWVEERLEETAGVRVGSLDVDAPGYPF